MPKLTVYDRKGKKVGTYNVEPTDFAPRINKQLLHDAVVMYQANQRQGTAKVKTRSEVHGSGKKPWKQKHTGRARMGTTKSPLWRGGGRIHPPAPRDHGYAMPKKARRAALRNALFTKFRDGEVAIASGWPTGKPSTKSAVAILGKLGMGKSATVVTTETDKNLCLSLRNVPSVHIIAPDQLNTYDVLVSDDVVFTRSAYDAFVAGPTTGKGAKAVATESEAIEEGSA